MGLFNSITKFDQLPGLNSKNRSKFRTTYQPSGTQSSLKSRLISLSKYNAEFGNLSKQNIDAIIKILKPYEIYIRGMKGTKGIGGLNSHHIKKIRNKLYKNYLNTRGQGDSEFSKRDYEDAMKIVGHLSISNRDNAQNNISGSAGNKLLNRSIKTRTSMANKGGFTSISRLLRRR
ncbi:MAG: hypothetical protein ABIH87_01720 [bacterium]